MRGCAAHSYMFLGSFANALGCTTTCLIEEEERWILTVLHPRGESFLR